jgi:hypothetical protein
VRICPLRNVSLRRVELGRRAFIAVCYFTETGFIMRLKFLLRRAPLMVAGILSTGALAACAHPRDIYDPAYNDTHRWNTREETAYRRWEGERSLQHAEYARRSADEQRAYWTWRHAHPD